MKASQHHLSLLSAVIDSVDLARVHGGNGTTPPTPPTSTTTTNNASTVTTNNTDQPGVYCTKGLDYQVDGEGRGELKTPMGVNLNGGFKVKLVKCQ